MKSEIKRQLQAMLENVEKTSIHNKSFLFRQNCDTECVKYGVLLEESKCTFSLRKWIAPRIMSKHSNRNMFTLEVFHQQTGEQCEVLWHKHADFDVTDSIKVTNVGDLNQMASLGLHSYEDVLSFFESKPDWLVNSMTNIDMALINCAIGRYDVSEKLLNSVLPDIHPKSPQYNECQTLLQWLKEGESELISSYIAECKNASETMFCKF